MTRSQKIDRLAECLQCKFLEQNVLEIYQNVYLAGCDQLDQLEEIFDNYLIVNLLQSDETCENSTAYLDNLIKTQYCQKISKPCC